MNISQAKDYIKNDVRLYLKKDEYGEYKIPIERQRPIFLLGAPGIGKTAIMEQVASELSVALVSYSMTHHTRQSALGLPFISHKSYEGMEYDVSEYTMSEIIASVYEVMEGTGIKEGILFLDEINCVSETLAPSMLQFLQYKVFGRHKVPDGWVIVTAGNPPEYNRSVREFDVVTLDRLKVLEVEADFETWKKYALERGIHNAILNFLEIKKEYFYHIETTVKGRSYVTARGWEDLSKMLSLYEEDGLSADETLVGQYIRNDRIVREFAAYYDLYNKYKKDYRIDDILAGEISETALAKAKAASFDERLSVLGMLMDKILLELKGVMETSDVLLKLSEELKGELKEKTDSGAGYEELAVYCTDKSKKLSDTMSKLMKANSLSDGAKKKYREMTEFYNELSEILEAEKPAVPYETVRAAFSKKVSSLKAESEKAGSRLHHVFEFVEKAYSDGNEMLIFVTNLTVNEYSSAFIARFGSEDYREKSSSLMLTERQEGIIKEIKDLGI